MSTAQLSGRTILITGGNGALGRAAADRAKLAGARALLLDRTFSPEVMAAHECHQVDLLSAEAVADALQGMENIDAIFNIAGGFDMGAAVADNDDGQWNRMFALNVSTLRNVLKVLVPRMQTAGRGSIVNVGAMSAREGKAAMSAYTASKAVVMNLTESLAAEMIGHGLRVNAVLPSIIDTPANRAAMPGADFTQWVSPFAIAEVMCFLASDSARAINGALIPVTAGQGK